MKATSPFTVDSFEPDPPYAQHEQTALGRATVRKTFTGDLIGKGEVHMTSAQAEGGRSYVAIEWIQGELHGNQGGFALLHAGEQGPDGQWATWRIVPGSGTQGLSGIRGTAEISMDDGAHMLLLDYQLPT